MLAGAPAYRHPASRLKSGERSEPKKPAPEGPPEPPEAKIRCFWLHLVCKEYGKRSSLALVYI